MALSDHDLAAQFKQLIGWDRRRRVQAVSGVPAGPGATPEWIARLEMEMNRTEERRRTCIEQGIARELRCTLEMHGVELPDLDVHIDEEYHPDALIDLGMCSPATALALLDVLRRAEVRPR